MGTRTGAFRSSGSTNDRPPSSFRGFGPQESDQKLWRDMFLEILRTGRLRRMRICCGEDDRQLGKWGPTGRPTWRIERRSGGKANSKEASMAAISSSVRPGKTGILKDTSRSTRVFAYAAKEKHTNGLGLGGLPEGM